MRILLILGALGALAACHGSSQSPGNQSASEAPPPPPPGGPVQGADRSHKGKLSPAVTFNDADGNPIGLGNFTGKPTLVNLWASWCVPCIKELPTLDKLAKARAGAINVVAVSQDHAPHASVLAFLKAHKIDDLGSYQDPNMGLSSALGVEVLPTSVLYDANGKEVWRYTGDMDWTSPEAAKLIAEGGGAQAN